MQDSFFFRDLVIRSFHIHRIGDSIEDTALVRISEQTSKNIKKFEDLRIKTDTNHNFLLASSQNVSLIFLDNVGRWTNARIDSSLEYFACGRPRYPMAYVSFCWSVCHIKLYPEYLQYCASIRTPKDLQTNRR